MQLEPGEVVTLVKVEGGGQSLRVRTTDQHPIEGNVPASFVRRKDKMNGVNMEGERSLTPLPSPLTPHTSSLILTSHSSPPTHLPTPLTPHPSLLTPSSPHTLPTVPPKFTMVPTDMDLLYGTTATISCAFNGFPTPSVEWRKERETVRGGVRVRINSCSSSSVLEIIKLCYDDVGVFTCFITNSRGSNSASMTLNIHGECGVM